MLKEGIKISWWAAQHPVASVAIVSAVCLLFLGLAYSIRYLFSAKIWGLSSHSGGSKDQASVFTLGAALLVLTGVTGMAWSGMQAYWALSSIEGSFDSTVNAIDQIHVLVSAKTVSLNSAIVSLNDSLLTQKLQTMGPGGRQAARQYADTVSKATRHLKELQRKTDRFEPIAQALDYECSRLREFRTTIGTAGSNGLDLSRDLHSPAALNAKYPWGVFWATMAERDFSKMALLLRRGGQQLEQQVKKAQKWMPWVTGEANALEDAVERDLLSRWLSRLDNITLPPSLNTRGILDSLQQARKEATSKAKRKKEQITRLKRGLMTVALLCIAAGLLALFVDRLRFPLLAIGSVALLVGAALFIYFAANRANVFYNDLRTFCKHSSSKEFLKLGKLRISPKTLFQLEQSLQKNSLDFAPFEKIKEGVELPLDKHTKIQLLNGSIRLTTSSSTRDHPFKGTKLKKVLSQLDKQSKQCSRAADLSFPQAWLQWHRWAARVLPVLNDMLAMYAQRVKETRQHNLNFLEILESLRQSILRAKGFSHTIVSLSRKLGAACRAQQEAIEKLAGYQPHDSQAKRIASKLDELKEVKTETLLKPVFETATLLPPLEQCKEAMCRDAKHTSQDVNLHLQRMAMAAVVSLIGSLVLSDILKLILRGLLVLMPFLEVFRIFT